MSLVEERDRDKSRRRPRPAAAALSRGLACRFERKNAPRSNDNGARSQTRDPTPGFGRRAIEPSDHAFITNKLSLPPPPPPPPPLSLILSADTRTPRCRGTRYTASPEISQRASRASQVMLDHAGDPVSVTSRMIVPFRGIVEIACHRDRAAMPARVMTVRCSSASARRFCGDAARIGEL